MLNRSLGCAALVLVALAACNGPERGPDAEKIVSHFVRADTLGSWDEAISLVAPCDTSATAPPIRVTRSVSVGGAQQGKGKDSILVAAYYQVAGTAVSGETLGNGVTVWHFTPAAATDTVTFRLGPDSFGRLMIACGPLPVHRAPMEMPDQVTQMDSASRAAFDAAVARR